MKKINYTLAFFLYSLLSYTFYIVVFIFIKSSDYGSGIYYFTPSFLFLFFKLFQSGIKKTAPVFLFTFLPFLISLYLTFVNHLPGWEVSGFIPLIALFSYLFKSSDKCASPLLSKRLNKVVGVFFLVLLFFGSVHFIKTKSIESALYLIISIYSPAPIAVAIALFVNFVISTATVSAILNNLKLFNSGTETTRFIFDSDKFLLFPHFTLSEIVTVENVSRKEFLEFVEKLNQAAIETAEYSKKIQEEKLFSKAFEEGFTLSMAPLKVMLSNKSFVSSNIALPHKKDDRSFVALAKDEKVIGYYAVDKIKATTNSSFLEFIKKKDGVSSIIVSPKEPKLWKNCCEIKNSIDEIEFSKSDFFITDEPKDSVAATQIVWGGCDTGRGDVFITKPFVTTLHNLLILSSNIKKRLASGIIFCSFPFAFPLFAISLGFPIPKISAVAVLFSFVFTTVFTFYVKPSKKRGEK
ncbi:MAG: hypothetical protein ACOX2F_02230 [bacterium]